MSAFKERQHTSLLANTSSTTCFAYSGSSQIKILSKTEPAFTCNATDEAQDPKIDN